jgi:DNA-binding transcriptional LysR family regulator
MAKTLGLTSFIRRLDLSTLDLFVSVCASGSIAAAAERGQLAVSSLSKRITVLEEAAGCALLERHARGVRPTLAGEAVLRHARGLMAGVGQLHEDLRAFAQGRLGSVHIAASASAVELYLPEDIARFAAAHPDVAIDLTQRASSEVLREVRDGRVDLGLCGASDAGNDLERRAYRMDQLVLLVPMGHPLARRRATDFEQSLDHEQIGLEGSSQVQTLLESAAARVGRALQQRIRVASIGSMCRMVESGLGIAVLPRGMVELTARPGLSRVVKLSDAWARLQLFVYARRFDQLSKPAELMLSHLLRLDKTVANATRQRA